MSTTEKKDRRNKELFLYIILYTICPLLIIVCSLIQLIDTKGFLIAGLVWVALLGVYYFIKKLGSKEKKIQRTMESLISMDYRNFKSEKSPVQCLNELTSDEVQDLTTSADLFETLTTKYVDKTFCIQTDYDSEFGNISWQRVYFYFADAENAILTDWDDRVGQPHYTIDKSYISVYTFSELNYADEKKKHTIVEELKNSISNIMKTGITKPIGFIDTVSTDENSSEPTSTTTKRNGETVNYDGIEFVFVEGGTFWMGATSEQGSDSIYNEKPVHQVTVGSFYIGKYAVTQAQWKSVMGDNRSYFKGDDLPVETVNWYEVQEFISKLNEQTGKNYRLPTESEWEFAARGGNKSRGYKYSGSNNPYDVTWNAGNSDGKTHPVGTKSPNELGLYDMSGNVWEWCNDWYDNYDNYKNDSQIDLMRPLSESDRMFRGGSWYVEARGLRVSARGHGWPGNASSDLGFRLACSSKSKSDGA